MQKKFMGVAVALLLVVFTVIPALAADATVTGTVLSVDTTAGTFQITTESGDVLTIAPPTGFDLSTLIVGDSVEVQGALDGTNLTATNVAPVSEDDSESPNTGFYCSNPDASQPGLAKLTVQYGADYNELLKEFCSGNGVGQIKLALQTSQTEGAPSAAELLAMKDELGGWGKVWQELGLVGNGHGHGHDGDESETGDDTETETETETENETETETHGNQGEDHAGGNSGEHGNGQGGSSHGNNGNSNGHGNNNGHGH